MNNKQLIPQSRSSFYFVFLFLFLVKQKSFLPLSSYFLKLLFLYSFLYSQFFTLSFLFISLPFHYFPSCFLFLSSSTLQSSYLPTSVQSLIQPSPLIHSLGMIHLPFVYSIEYDRSYQDRLLTPNSSILFNYQPSLPLELVFTTTMHESSSTLPIDMINTLNMFHLFEQQFPFKAIIFSSSPSVITYCQNHSLVVISQIKYAFLLFFILPIEKILIICHM